MLGNAVSTLDPTHARAGAGQILGAGLVGRRPKGEIEQAVFAGNDRPVTGVGPGELNGYRADGVPTEHAATGNDDLELIDEVEVRLDDGAGFLLDQKCLRLTYLERLGIDIYRRVRVDQLRGRSRRRRAEELGAP